jgi:DNA polymerase III subunit delta'
MSFREIVGHRRLLDLLSRSIASGALPPSLIFSGPDGVGKRRVAEAVAQALNCMAPVKSPAGPGQHGGQRSHDGGVWLQRDLEFDACGQCPACNRIARGMFGDVLMIGPGESGSIKIEQIRDAIDRTIYRPFEGKRRVTVINDADALVPAAQNALLKTLEEPPSSSVFILVTSRPDALLSTVRSRCSQIRFARLSSADVAAVLERDHKYLKREALVLAAAADGSVGRALDVEAGDFAEARSDAEQLLHAARSKGDARTRVERAKDLVKVTGGPAASEREYLGARLQALSSLVRDLGVLATGAGANLLANVDLRSELDELTASFDSERALHVFAAVERAQGALDRNVSPKVVADWLALQI